MAEPFLRNSLAGPDEDDRSSPTLVVRRHGIQMGDGGGDFSSKYFGGQGTDAPFEQSGRGRIGYSGVEPGKAGAEMDAHAKLTKFAKMFFRGQGGDAHLDDVLRAAYENFPEDRELMQAVDITARSMGATPPWDRGSRR